MTERNPRPLLFVYLRDRNLALSRWIVRVTTSGSHPGLEFDLTARSMAEIPTLAYLDTQNR
jgi:hypothetical protein